MDPARKKALKKAGKLAIEIQSEALKLKMAECNPAPITSDAWMHNHKLCVSNEQWLRKRVPAMHAALAERLFIVSPDKGGMWGMTGQYCRCLQCRSVAPTALPRWRLYWWSCQCGNIRLRQVGPWGAFRVRESERLQLVSLMARAVPRHGRAVSPPAEPAGHAEPSPSHEAAPMSIRTTEALSASRETSR